MLDHHGGQGVIVVVPFCEKDSDQALRLLDWIGQLGGAAAYHCLLVADAGVSWGVGLDAVQLASKAFRSATIITNDEPVDGWIPGSASLFFTAAEHLEKERIGPWLWIEPDCAPLRSTWLDEISVAYAKCGRPFMGHVYKCDSPSLPRENLSGIAVYAHDAFSRLKNWRDSTLAFDVACAYVTVPEAAHTELIHHYWGMDDQPPTLVETKGPDSPHNSFQFSTIPKGAALFHRCKDTSLIRLLKKNSSSSRPLMKSRPASSSLAVSAI